MWFNIHQQCKLHVATCLVQKVWPLCAIFPNTSDTSGKAFGCCCCRASSQKPPAAENITDHFLLTFWITVGFHFGPDGPDVIFTAGPRTQKNLALQATRLQQQKQQQQQKHPAAASAAIATGSKTYKQPVWQAASLAGLLFEYFQIFLNIFKYFLISAL